MSRRGSARRYQFDDEAEILRTYQIARSGQLDRWEDFDGSVDDFTDSTTVASGRTDETDALGLRRGGTLASLPNLPPDVKSSILLNSKNFDPKTFLATVHPNAAFKDLHYGREHLKDSLEQRSEALKVLVEQEFDRFISVKATTGAVFEEMKLGPLAEGSEYGLKQLKSVLKEATTRADQVYTPILDAAMKANRLRSTLTVFERSKHFFNLPSTLMEAIETGRYEAALQAYKKGQYMFNGRPHQLLGLPPSAAMTPEQEAQAKRIYDKVWGRVTMIINDLKTTLFVKLRDPHTGIEDVEKLANILYQLDATDDPIWIYLETQHELILQRINAAFESAVNNYKATLESASLAETTFREEITAAELRKCVRVVDLPTEANTVFEAAAGADIWKSVLAVSRKLAETIVASLPGFWKVSQSYVQGKYQKTPATGATKRPTSAVYSMTNEIVTTYVNLVYQFYQFASPTPAVAEGEPTPLPSFVPANSNSLSVTFYVSRLLTELSDVANELMALNPPQDALNDLKDLIATARWQFVDTVCLAWLRDAKIFYRLENWHLDPDQASSSSATTATLYPKSIDAFQRALGRRVYLLAGGSESSAASIFLPSVASKTKVKPDQLPKQFVDRIQATYLDALYAFLDGLVHVAFSPPMVSTASTSAPVFLLSSGKDAQHRSVSVEDVDTRIMLTVANLAHLNQHGLVQLVGQFETAFRVDMSNDFATLQSVVSQVDQILFDDFTRRKSQEIAAIIQRGILHSGMDWLETPKPTEVHSWVYQVLLSLVLIHAHVLAVARPLIQRTLSILILDIASAALSCFNKVEHFGMGGMLQATLEIEFMHQTLSHYVTPEADAKLQEVYQVISQSYYRRPQSHRTSATEDDSSELSRELDQLKKTQVFVLFP